MELTWQQQAEKVLAVAGHKEFFIITYAFFAGFISRMHVYLAGLSI